MDGVERFGTISDNQLAYCDHGTDGDIDTRRTATMESTIARDRTCGSPTALQMAAERGSERALLSPIASVNTNDILTDLL